MNDEPLRLTLPLMGDEGTLDFLSRLAARNGVGTMGKFCTDQGLSSLAIRDGCLAETAKLGRLAGVPVNHLAAATIRKDVDGYCIRGERLVLDALRTRTHVACPACLKADIETSSLAAHVAAYARLAWRLDVVRTCPIHGIGLMDLGTTPNWTSRDFSALVRRRFNDLSALVDQATRRPASELERYVIGRLAGVTGAAPFLDGLELHVVARTCEVIGAYATYGRGVLRHRLEDHDLYVAGAVGIVIAGAGEAAIHDFMTDLWRHYPYGHRVRSGPRPPVADFRTWAKGTRGAAYAPIKALVAAHPDGLYAHLPEDKRGTAGLDAMANCRRPRRVLPTEPMLSVDFDIAATCLASKRGPRAPMLTAYAAMDRLGCGPALFVALQACSLIVPAGASSGWRHEYHFAEVDALLDLVLADAHPMKTRSGSKACIVDVARETPCTQVEIVRLLLAGALAWKGRHEGRKGISSVMVCREEVRQKVEAYTASGPTLREARLEMNMSTGMFAHAIALGVIRNVQVLDAITGCKVNIIDQKSIDDFYCNYVNIDQMCWELSIPKNYARDRLKSHKIKNVIGVKGEKNTYYIKKEVFELDNLIGQSPHRQIHVRPRRIGGDTRPS